MKPRAHAITQTEDIGFMFSPVELTLNKDRTYKWKGGLCVTWRNEDRCPCAERGIDVNPQ